MSLNVGHFHSSYSFWVIMQQGCFHIIEKEKDMDRYQILAVTKDITMAEHISAMYNECGRRSFVFTRKTRSIFYYTERVSNISEFFKRELAK